MMRLVRTELLKQRTVRSFVAGVAAAPVVGALVAVAVLDAAGSQGNDPLGPDSLVTAVGAPASVVTLIALLLGLLAMAGEHRHETITTTFLAAPRRRRVVLAKLAASSLVAAGAGALCALGSAAVGMPWLRSAGVAVTVDGEVLGVAAGLVTSTALYGALGVSVGALVRSPAAAVAVVLTWLLALEGIVADVFAASGVGRWLPASTGRALVSAGMSEGALDPPVAAAAFGAYVACFATAAVVFTLRRDVT
jgi:ABC-2 type transport system permease protein